MQTSIQIFKDSQVNLGSCEHHMCAELKFSLKTIMDSCSTGSVAGSGRSRGQRAMDPNSDKFLKIRATRWLSLAFRLYKIQFRPWLRLGPRWRSLRHSPMHRVGCGPIPYSLDAASRCRRQRLRGSVPMAPRNSVSGSAPGVLVV